MTPNSSAPDQHRVFLSLSTFDNSLKTEAPPVNPCHGLCHHSSLLQMCWAHAALQVSMQYLFYCFFLQAGELLRAPEKIWFEFQQHQGASHKFQQSCMRVLCGVFEHWHLIVQEYGLHFCSPLENMLLLLLWPCKGTREAGHSEQNLTLANVGMFTWTSGSKEKMFCLPSFLLSLFSWSVSLPY